MGSAQVHAPEKHLSHEKTVPPSHCTAEHPMLCTKHRCMAQHLLLASDRGEFPCHGVSDSGQSPSSPSGPECPTQSVKKIVKPLVNAMHNPKTTSLLAIKPSLGLLKATLFV